MTEVIRGERFRVTLDAPGQYNVRRISDDTVTLLSPYSTATEAAIDLTLAEHQPAPPRHHTEDLAP